MDLILGAPLAGGGAGAAYLFSGGRGLEFRRSQTHVGRRRRAGPPMAKLARIFACPSPPPDTFPSGTG
ncbi:MAG: hypothetical protein ACOZNI_03890 [Myxococcota bacterium]